MMKLFAFFHVSALVLVDVSSASCPNACSGHGTCTPTDQCVCYGLRHGADCSLKMCPRAPSWTQTIPPITTTPVYSYYYHTVTECSDGGTCDTSTGKCSCFPGYGGVACHYRSALTAEQQTRLHTAFGNLDTNNDDQLSVTEMLPVQQALVVCWLIWARVWTRGDLNSDDLRR